VQVFEGQVAQLVVLQGEQTADKAGK